MTVEYSSSVTFLPENHLKTGTYFIVFCISDNIPETGKMLCDNEGIWLNAPKCEMKKTTSAITDLVTHADVVPTLNPGKQIKIDIT